MNESEIRGAIVLRTPGAIARYRLLVLRAGIKLELKGLRHSRGKWHMTGIAARELGLDSKTKAPAVLAKLEEYINSLDA